MYYFVDHITIALYITESKTECQTVGKFYNDETT